MPNLGGIDISPVILFLIIIFIQNVIELYIIPQRLLSAMALRRQRNCGMLTAEGCARRAAQRSYWTGCATADARIAEGDSMSAKIIDGKAIAADLRAKLGA